MYKFLPILLFAFLAAEENQESHFVQSDSLDFIKTEEMLDEEIDVFKYKLQRSKSFDEDKFLINVDREVYDVKRVDTSYSEMKDSILNEMKNKFSNILLQAIKEIGYPHENIIVQIPNNPNHGDFTTNYPLITAKKLNLNPMSIANKIVKLIKIPFVY